MDINYTMETTGKDNKAQLVQTSEILNYYNLQFLIIVGDFNACMISSEDSINRNKSLNEEKLTDYIKANNDTCEVVDAYRKQFQIKITTILVYILQTIYTYNMCAP